MIDVGRRKQAEAAHRESEERFLAIFEGAAIGIVLLDLEGRILQTNPALQRMLGYPANRLAGVHFAEITYPDDLTASSELFFKQVAGERDSFQLEKRHLRADGAVLWTRTTSALRRNAAGEPWFIIVTIEDISDRKREEAERALLQQREHQAWGAAERRAREEAALREAAEAISVHFTVEAVVRQIAQSALTATNADGAFVEKLDIRRGELEVVAVAGELTPALEARISYSGSLVEEVIRRGEPELVTEVVKALNQFPGGFAERCAECSVLLIPLADAGEAVGALVLLRKAERQGYRPDEVGRARIFRNLAALAFGKAHLLEESERKRIELEQVQESRVRLMRGFTHDVKNPLGAADGYMELLEMELQGALTEKQRESVDRTRRALGAALRLIDDLLDFARAESGHLEIRHQPADVREVAREIAEEYRLQAEEASLTLETELARGLPIIDSDVSRVRQILGNLVTNAIRHTPARAESWCGCAGGMNRPPEGGSSSRSATRPGDPGRPVRADLRGVRPSESERPPGVWTRARHQSPGRPCARRRDHRAERAGEGLHLHPPAPPRAGLTRELGGKERISRTWQSH